jgi:hypothetical protein
LKLALPPLTVAGCYVYASTVQGGIKFFNVLVSIAVVCYLAAIISNIIQFPRSDKKSSE